MRPAKHGVVASLTEALRILDEADSWAGRVSDVGQNMKRELDRSTNHILAAVEPGNVGEGRLRESGTAGSEGLGVAEATSAAAIRELQEKITNELVDLRKAVTALVANGGFPPVGNAGAGAPIGAVAAQDTEAAATAAGGGPGQVSS